MELVREAKGLLEAGVQDDNLDDVKQALEMLAEVSMTPDIIRVRVCV